MKKITGYFIKGLLFLLPLLIAISILRNTLLAILPAGAGLTKSLLVLGSAIILTTILGFLLSKGTRFYFKWRGIKALSKFPFFGQIITSAKKFFLILNFSQEIFEHPVVVKREKGKELKFGFITRESLEEFGMKDHASVYLPNPFSFLGEVVVIAHKDLEPIEKGKSEVSNFILSGGVLKK